MKGPEYEARIVGAVLAAGQDGDPMKVLQAAGLHPEVFSDSMLRTALAIAIDLARAGERCNAYTVHARGQLTRAFKAEDLGFLETLQARNALDVRTVAQIANDLRRVAGARELGKQLGELAREVSSSLDPGKSVARFNALREEFLRMHAVAGRRGSDVINAKFADYERRRESGRVGWRTSGMHALDKALDGGLPPTLAVMLGAPGTLKTGFAAAMVERQCLEGLKPCVFTFEDGDDWLAKRLLAKRLGMKFGQVFEAPWPDELAVPDAAQELSNTINPAWIFTDEHCDRTANSIIRLATQKIAQGECDCVWIDNARHVHCPLEHRGDSKHDAISRMYYRLAKFAHSNRVPVMLLAHTTRKYWERCAGRAPPQMSDISETGDAERDVRLLLGIWWKWGRLRLSVPKHTQGEPGKTLQFERLAEAGLVDVDSGDLVDLDEERKKERAAAEERSDEKSVATSARRKKMRADLDAAEAAAAAKAPKPEEPPPQLELIPGGAGEKPEEPKP